MKTGRFLAVALATATSIPLMAMGQEGGTPAVPASPAAVQVPTAPNTSAAAAAELKPVKAELEGKLDSKNAKEGDNVVVKTKETVTTADGTEIPKGSKLMGHVATVRAHSKDVQNAQMTLEFDRAQLKGGQSVAIQSTIQAIAPPEGQVADNSGAFSGVPAGATPGSAGGAMAGGGRTVTGTATSVPAPMTTPGTDGTATPSAGTAAGSTSQAGGSQAGRVVAGSGANAIRTTDVPNIYLASNAGGPVSGTLFSAKSNVHLDDGTEMVLGVATGAH